MHSAAALAILVLSDLCLAIRVPIEWGHSDAQHEPLPQPSQVHRQPQKIIPTEYFVYTAEKPQFAVDIAAFHGVQSPGEYYKAYPVRPYTGKEKPELGKHKILDEDREVFQPFQAFTKKNEALRNQVGGPLSVDYEVFHPYKAEEPALQQIYRDPVLAKIRNDIRDSEHILQNYEKEAGKPDITPDEYLESPEQTDRKKIPHRNVPTPFEIHRPQRRPVYYRPTPYHNNRDQILNRKFKHPWNQNYAKIRPVNYRPLKKYLGRLRQHHASKYDDERNEYPQPPPPQAYSEPVDGYDIYQKGKDNYVKLRNNIDESINKAVKENRPTIFQKLELQNNGDRTETQISDDGSDDENNGNDDEDEFVPVKNYAQVRKTETTKHVPRDDAINDAESFDEIRNAPRLREAIKSTKAQTVYTEEGYEDAAFDHAGEQKHASENEDHAGFLKEKEISAGKYKIPSFSGAYEDANGNAYRDQNLHGKKWKNSDKNDEEQTDSEDYSEDEDAHSIEAEIYEDVTGERNKRENHLETNMDTSQDENQNSKENESESNTPILYGIEKAKTENNSHESSEVDQVEKNSQHEMNKRETNFKVPEIDLNSTFWNEDEYKKLAELKLVSRKDDIRDKYPYYFKNLKSVHRDSPLRYSENLKLIPKKSNGGTEFYDSRSQFECPDVDDKVDALPEKLKKNGHPDEAGDSEDSSKQKGEPGFDNVKENPRLKGLGDKIDCFKAKYFGENPLDSPFFKEELISNPEPVTAPNLAVYKLNTKEPIKEESQFINIFNVSDKLRNDTKTDVFILLDKLRNGQKELQESLVRTNANLRSSLRPTNGTAILSTQFSHPSNIYSDVLGNIQNAILIHVPQESIILNNSVNSNLNSTTPNNLTYKSYENKQDVTQLPPTVRRKRATPFIYEPYKIIRDGQVQDSKKTTTTSNISPLIRQLQSSRVVDRVTNLSQDKEQPVKRNVATRAYKDIGRKDREKPNVKEGESEDRFVDVNTDKRRGEPRYELRPVNHKSQYTPVENIRAMSLEDYKAQTNKTITEIQAHDNKSVTHSRKESNLTQPQVQSHSRSRQRSPTVTPYYDVSQFLPKSDELQNPAASNKVSKVIKVTTSVPDGKSNRPSKLNMKSAKVVEKIDNEKDYEEYDDEDESTTTTTTSPKPLFRIRKARVTTTTIKPKVEEEVEPELPKLRLTTRFRNTPNKKTQNKEESSEKPSVNKFNKDHDAVPPKYREKKRKSTKSTLVTDTKTYNDGDVDGDEEDDLRKEEVDALIGIRQDMDEYIPHYEKHVEREKERESLSSTEEDDEEYDDDEFDDDDEEYDDEEVDDEEVEQEPAITTPEPTKRTLARTTEAPVSTTEVRSAKLELKPLVTRKKYEIHKELPVNKSSPHITQFKQDIKEVEIIKEMPNKPIQRKHNKNLEALDLYKDDNLAKDINKLGGVEVFKQNLDLNTAPKHGGNYRSAKLIELQEDIRPKPHHGGNLKVGKEDADTSQSENTKLIELGDDIPARRMHGGNLKSISDVQRSRSTSRNARLEFADPVEKISSRGRKMHGGNFRLISDNERRRENSNNAKIIEFDDERDDEDESTSRMHGGNFKSYGNSRDDNHPFHGGNYRNAKLVQAAIPEKDETVEKGQRETNTQSKAADLLNSFAQAVPMITTTPAFIRDPSKRMYYYVDA